MDLFVKTANAQGTFSKVAQNSAVNSLVTKLMDSIVLPLVSLLFFVMVIVFLWGLYGLIARAGDPVARAEGQRHILWGVIGMFIMISAYGIIRLIGNTVGVGDPFL